MKNFTILLLALFTLFMTSCDDDGTPDCLPVMTDPSANLDDFLGLWYEIGSIPQFFNPGCACTTAEYTLLPDGETVGVYNSCIRFGFPSDIEGTAVAPDPSDFSKLEVSFPVSPTPGEYWILVFEPEDGYMMVGDSDRTQLYILSRTPDLDAAIYDSLLEAAEFMCFNTNDLEITDQSNCASN